MEKLNSSTKATFLNLPIEKRNRIEYAAVREFAEYGFHQASVNRIVKDTGIAKGSLYQYFNGKEGLFLHVFENFTEQIRISVKKSRTPGKRKLFDQIRLVIRAGFDFIESHPDYFRLYIRLLRDESTPHREELVNKVRLFNAEFFEPLIRRGQDSGLVRKDVPGHLIVFMIDTLLERLFVSYAEPETNASLLDIDPSNPDAVIDLVLCLLESGISETSS